MDTCGGVAVRAAAGDTDTAVIAIGACVAAVALAAVSTVAAITAPARKLRPGLTLPSHA
jgi:hypothetical protein